MNSIYLSSNICIPFHSLFNSFCCCLHFLFWPDIHVSGRAALLDLRPLQKSASAESCQRTPLVGASWFRGPKHRCFQGLKGASPHLPPIYPPSTRIMLVVDLKNCWMCFDFWVVPIFPFFGLGNWNPLVLVLHPGKPCRSLPFLGLDLGKFFDSGIPETSSFNFLIFWKELAVS